MISKNKTKLIRSLETKKGREKSGLFVAEGPKTVGDLIAAGFKAEMIIDDEADARQVSFLRHPQGVVGVFHIPGYGLAANDGQASDDGQTEGGIDTGKLSLALDGVQDPGNLGTIIRIADWFGIDDIYCSRDTADCWSPKVVQATMGSIARVRVRYCDLGSAISSLPEGFPVYGTFLDGSDIYSTPLSAAGLIVMGNEGNGISEGIRRLVTHRLLIPNYPQGRQTADSLNVAIATAITCAEFRRRNYGSDL